MVAVTPAPAETVMVELPAASPWMVTLWPVTETVALASADEVAVTAVVAWNGVKVTGTTTSAPAVTVTSVLAGVTAVAATVGVLVANTTALAKRLVAYILTMLR